jgi:hypothetical protein
MIPFWEIKATPMATRKTKRTAKTARKRTAAKRTKKVGRAAKRVKSTTTRKRVRTGGVAKKAKRASRLRGYNPQTGSPAGRAVGDLERLEQLTAEFMAQGLSAHDARERARAIMRSAP